LFNIIVLQCVIDLRQGVLKIGDETVPFLAEKDIPKDLRDEQHDDTMEDVAPNNNQNNTTPNTASNPTFPETTIQELINLGFSRERCIEALK